jgi:3-methyl-2-oxobutanoate hydroxymethyltransferase
MMKKITTSTLKGMKQKNEPIAMVTAYDYPTAACADRAGIDVILVGDSLGMVVLGYDSTIPVTVADMLHHTKAVTRGASQALVVTDLPFLSYHGSFDRTLEASASLMQEGGAHAVKLEGGSEMVETIQRLTLAGVPVMGHIGLTPQSVYQLGGYKVQGKDRESAQKLISDAIALEKAGVFALVLECIPTPLAKEIRDRLTIPTIGIGAGIECDGQVLVFHDMVSYGSKINPKFVKRYSNIGEQITQSIESYITEVKERNFPKEEHSFSMKEEVVAQLYGGREE